MYFPITVIDDFYDNFNIVKNYLHLLNFKKKTFYTMPGLETDLISDLNPHLFKQSVNKILSIHFNRGNNFKQLQWECRTKFEKITPLGEDYNKEGWIHYDDDNKLTGILYIQGDYDDGTSFFKLNQMGLPDYSRLQIKEKLYSGHHVDPKIYNKALNDHNSNFQEILNVPCVPNRLVLFDSSMLHRGNGFGTVDKPRIIQTFFFGQINSDSFPIPEMKRFDF